MPTPTLSRPCAAALLAALLGAGAPAQAQELFNHAAYLSQVGGNTIAGFDAWPAGTLLGANSVAGLSIAARRIAVVDPQDFAPGLLVGGQNLQSQPTGLSASIFYSGSTLVFDNGNDDFVFRLASPSSAAGIWIGNLGANNNDPVTPTVASFRDAQGNLLATEVFTQAHPGLVGSGANNRVFYGLLSVVPIAQITVSNGAGDFDGLILDDVQWATAVPEPGTWAMLLAGAALLGWRRRA